MRVHIVVVAVVVDPRSLIVVIAIALSIFDICFTMNMNGAHTTMMNKKMRDDKNSNMILSSFFLSSPLSV